MLEPAHSIIRLCGGFEAVARMTGRSEIRVRRWTYPRDRGGTGGLIPSDCQEPLLLAAIQLGIPLTPTHFFPHVVPAVASLLASDAAPDIEAAE